MIQSMTGYGSADLEHADFSLNIEIRSVNSKFLDLHFRMHPAFNEKEVEIRSLFNDHLERGKVNLFVKYTPKGKSLSKIFINQALLEQYYQLLLESAEKLSAPSQDLFRMALSMPEVQASETDDLLMETQWPLIKSTIEAAIQSCKEFRFREGGVLAEMLLGCIQTIENLLVEVEKRDPERMEYIRQRLQKHMLEISRSESFDQNRFEQELIYYMEKLDVNEEKVRLKSHLDFFRDTLKGKDSNGKRLGFIAQEIGREINTLGSKANDAQIQKLVVGMKDELEKIKEQVLNVV